jgi:hypothetical protein
VETPLGSKMQVWRPLEEGKRQMLLFHRFKCGGPSGKKTLLAYIMQKKMHMVRHDDISTDAITFLLQYFKEVV